MVQQIEINGKAVRVLFGMHFAENFSNEISSQLKEDGSINLSSSKFTTILIWFGYLNWCEVKDEPAQVTKSDVYEWVEGSYSENDEARIAQMVSIIAVYNKSTFAKGIEKVNEEAKKKLNGQTLEVSPLVLSD